MRFLCMVRWDESGPPLTRSEDEALILEHFAYDRMLRASGHLIEASALQLEHTATLVRVRDGKLSATDGPFAETKEHLGGFLLIEAADREEAIRIAAGIPSARTGWIEVRPIRDLVAELEAAAGEQEQSHTDERRVQ